MGKKRQGNNRNHPNAGKNYLVTGIVVGIIFMLFLAGVGAIFYFSQRISQPERKTETVVVLKDTGGSVDLPNPDEGTLRIDFRAVESDVDVGESAPTKVLLFRSKVLEGLSVYYLYEEKNITAGMPRLTSPAVNLLDGSMHTVIYTFKRGYKQMLIVDGQVMAESKFSPAVKQAPTGFLVYSPEKEVSNDRVGVAVSSYGRMVEPNEVSSRVSTTGSAE
jgi:hypothetical protein